ncbi:MAG: hypothetical protein AAF491_12265, partial [Verrucomicrobiota bacterium]
FYVWTVLWDLMRNGFRTDDRGTTIIHEHATAKGYTKKDGFGDSFADILETITQGQVTMRASGRFDDSLFAQVFSEGIGKQSAGNFRFKASLESAFHRIRTQSAGLLGDVGNRYQVTPEHNAKIDRCTSMILRSIDKLPPEEQQAVFDLVRFPKHTWRQFTQLINLVYSAVNRRTDHNLEGWGDCGFILPGYALPNHVHPNRPPELFTCEDFLALEPKAQEHIKAFGKDHDIVLSTEQAVALCRKTDPHIQRLDIRDAVHALPLKWAYGNRGSKQNGIKVQANGTLVIRDPERFGQSSLVYFASYRHGKHNVHLRAGERCLVHICPFDPDKAILLDLQGRFLGEIKPNVRARVSDTEQRLRTQGQINQYRSEVTRSSALRHEDRVEQLREDLKHNERVISGEITPDETTLHHERQRHQQNRRDEAALEGVVIVEPDSESDSDDGDDLNFDDVFANKPNLDNS